MAKQAPIIGDISAEYTGGFSTSNVNDCNTNSGSSPAKLIDGLWSSVANCMPTTTTGSKHPKCQFTITLAVASPIRFFVFQFGPHSPSGITGTQITFRRSGSSSTNCFTFDSSATAEFTKGCTTPLTGNIQSITVSGSSSTTTSVNLCEIQFFMACDPGTYMAVDTSTCVACEVGLYCAGTTKDGAGAYIGTTTPRYQCPAGKFGATAGLSAASCTGDCAIGHYCVAGSTSATATQCPAGFFGATTGLGTSTCSGQCNPGFWCAAGSTTATANACPAGKYGSTSGLSTAACTADCSAGYYCPAASTSSTAVPCPAGRFGNTLGLSAAACSGPCSAGYYCPAASLAATQTICPPGTYGATTGLSSAACTGPCPSGSFCTAGTTDPSQSLCPEGRYGATTGLTTSLCSGACAAGYYCPAGSTSAQQVRCPAGTYGVQTGLGSSTCSGLCSQGYYCPAGSSSASQTACPAGRYGSSLGLSSATCDGLCSPGYFCGAASISATASACPAGTYRATGGASAQGDCTPCAAGRYGSATAATASSCTGPCAIGYYCPAGSLSPTQVVCPAGTIGDVTGLGTPTCNGACPRGYYCTAGTTSATQTPCPAGKFGATTGLADSGCSGACALGYYCPAGSTTAAAVLCPAGRYGALTGLGTTACSGACAAGSYCAAGSTNSTSAACPAGRYGSSLGLSASTCDGLCAAGYYCPERSASATAIACPPGTFRSSAGASALSGCSMCPAGSFGSTAAMTAATCEGSCSVGYYCPAGSLSATQLLCPAGTYGDAGGLGTAACSGTCPIGHYCSAGTTAATQSPCPAGRFGASTGLTSSACTGSCAQGYYCPAGSTTGTEFRCPPGRYGATVGLGTNACSGNCAAGSYCPAGSTNSTAAACPAGRFGSSLGLTSAACDGLCTPGYFCPAGSVSSKTTACPAGTFRDTAGGSSAVDCKFCAAGRYGSATASTSATCDGSCSPGYYCPAGSLSPTQNVCPAGRYGDAGGLGTIACSGECPVGYYCPAGTTSATQNACPEGRFGSAPSLAASTCSGACAIGYYCPAASTTAQAVICPAGRYGAQAGLGASSCSGACSPGFFCPTGSTNSTAVPCAAGRYGSSIGLSAAACDGLCEAGYFCIAGSISSRTAACPAGKYRAVAGGSTATDCTLCSAGRYGSMTASTSATCDGPCNPGNYCPAGSRSPVAMPCPAGTFGAVSGLTAATCSGTCPMGYYCPEATIVGTTNPCPAGRYSSVTGATGLDVCLPCAAGAFCPAGSISATQSLCPAGRFGSAAELGTSDCTGACDRGYYCPAGSTSARAVPCPAGKYSSSLGGVDVNSCTQCAAGRYGSATALVSAGCSGACSPGFWCDAGATTGTQNPCAAGLYGSSPGLGTADCTGLCEAGYYCPAMSISSRAVSCPGGTYNPNIGGSSAAACIGCPAGHFCLPGSPSPTACGAVNMYCPAGASNRLSVDIGYYSINGTTSTRSAQVLCELDYYCSGGVRFSCPLGTFASRTGLTDATCSGFCAAGHYCPRGSRVATQFTCGGNHRFCPAGASNFTEVAAGHFSTGGTPNTRTGESICPFGTYCDKGVSYPCPAGRFGAVLGATSLASGCPGVCPAGYACAAGSTQGTAVPCGLRDGARAYCPQGSGAPVIVTVGYFSAGNASALYRTHQMQCEEGTYCSLGVQYPCPAGRFGSIPGLSSESCSGSCPAGHFCPTKSISGTARPCGSPEVYCPAGSPSPTVAPVGTFTIGGTGPTTRINFQTCAAGSYCVRGVAALCPPGRYASNPGLDTSGCEGPCAAGYYCASGSTSSTQFKCGGPDKFCPLGSHKALAVLSGHYTIGGDATTRSSQRPCMPGYFCVAGVISPCPFGTYGSVYNLTTPQCSGLCGNGSVCLAGSSVMHPVDCPAGFWCAYGKVTPCLPGTYNPLPAQDSPDACVACPAHTYQPVFNQTSPTMCLPCVAPEDSNERAAACWPGLSSAVADDLAPVYPGISSGDVVYLTFTKPTNRPPASTAAQLAQLLAWSASLGEGLTGQWSDDGTTLRVTLGTAALANGEPVDIVTTRIGSLTIHVLPTANIRDAKLLSQPLKQDPMLVSGTWGKPKTPAFLKTGDSAGGAIARNLGLQAGLGTGDVLILRFDNPVKQLPVATKADLDNLFTFSGSLGEDYTGQWAQSGAFKFTMLTITIAKGPNVKDLANVAATAVGTLRVTVKASAGLRSLDESTAPSNDTVVVRTGSWGDSPTSFVVDVDSWKSLRATLVVPDPLTHYALTDFRLQWSLSPSFPAGSTTTVAMTKTGATQAVGFIEGLTTGVPVHVRAGAQITISDGTGAKIVEWAPMLAAPQAVPPTKPRVDSVTLRVGKTMPTPGGAIIDVRGQFLGLSPGSRLTYSNGRFTFEVPSCEVVKENVHVQCTSVPGVGAGHRAWLTVNGGQSNPSADLIHYDRPVITAFAGPGAKDGPTSGGQLLYIEGQNFGPTGLDSVDYVMHSPAAFPSLRFVVSDCTVSVAHAQLQCLTDPAAGTKHDWSVTIANQSSSTPSTSYASPIIQRVLPVRNSRPLDMLSTAGGDVLQIDGSDFGDGSFLSRKLQSIWLTTDAGVQVTKVSCNMTHPHTQLTCFMPPGTGQRLRLQTELLGQMSPVSDTTLSYGPPDLQSVNVAPNGLLSTRGGDSLTAVGSNLGADSRVVDVLFCVDRISNNDLSRCVTVPIVRFVQPHVSVLCNTPPLIETLADTDTLWVYLRVNGAFSPSVRVNVALPVLNALSMEATESYDPAAGSGSDIALGNCLNLAIATGGLAVMVVTGTDFGSSPTTVVNMQLRPTGSHSNVACSVCYLDHSKAMCISPIGVGTLNFITRGSTVVRSFDINTANQPPSVRSLSIYINTTGAMVAPLWPTTGSALLVAQGSLFKSVGTAFLRQLGTDTGDIVSSQLPTDVPCDSNVYGGVWTDGEIRCQVPAGAGAGYNLLIKTRATFGFSIATFSYMPPTITDVIPDTLPTIGGNITILGNNFGAPAVRIQVTVSGTLCDSVVHNHTHISCVAPPGAEATPELVVAVAGQSVKVKQRPLEVGSQPRAFLAYEAPVVWDFFPKSGNTAGGSSIMITGANFGPEGAGLTVKAHSDAATAPPDATWPVVWHNHTHMVVRTTPGIDPGSGFQLLVSTRYQSATSIAARFRYEPPVIVSITSTTPDVGCPPHGCTLVLVGQNFGVSAPAVSYGTDGRPCIVQESSHTLIKCDVSSGSGANIPVFVRTGGLRSTAGRFSYNGPRIKSITPDSAPATTTFEATVSGRYFGDPGFADINVQFTLLPTKYSNETRVANCVAGARHASDGEIKCQVASAESGTWQVEVIATQQVSREPISVVRYCPPGFFGREGEQCDPCPRGAVCGGNGSDPVAAVGYYQDGRITFSECTPAEACLGGSGSPCASGYEGVRCSMCQDRHYRMQQQCVACPDFAQLYLVMFVLALGVIIAIAYQLHKRRVNIAALTIGIDFMQVLAIFAALDFAWPPELTITLAAMSASSLNMQVLAPECSVKWAYQDKWFIVQSMPVAILAAVLTAVIITNIVVVLNRFYLKRVKKLTLRVLKARGEFNTTFLDALWGVFFGGLSLLYFPLVRNAIAVLDCTTNSNGLRAMTSEPSVICSDSNPVYVQLQMWAVITLVLYGAGIPGLFALVLIVFKDKIRADQQLKQMGLGDTPGTNPQLNVRRRFSKLYENFSGQRYYWGLVQLARKLLLLLCSVSFHSKPMFQASVSAFIMFVSYALHAAFKPFLMRMPTSQDKLDLIAQQGEDTQSLRRLMYVFDYNRLEAGLLGSSTLVLLSGMVFQSSAFPEHSIEYLVITLVIILIISSAVIGFSGVVVLEMYRSIKFSFVLYRTQDKLERTVQFSANPMIDKAQAALLMPTDVLAPPKPKPNGRRAASMAGNKRGSRWQQTAQVPSRFTYFLTPEVQAKNVLRRFVRRWRTMRAKTVTEGGASRANIYFVLGNRTRGRRGRGQGPNKWQPPRKPGSKLFVPGEDAPPDYPPMLPPPAAPPERQQLDFLPCTDEDVMPPDELPDLPPPALPPTYRPPPVLPLIPFAHGPVAPPPPPPSPPQPPQALVARNLSDRIRMHGGRPVRRSLWMPAAVSDV